MSAPPLPTARPLAPARVFLLMMALFGPALALLTPPMQVADEPNHFYRIWQILDGHLLSPHYQAAVPLDLSKMGTRYPRDHAHRSLWQEIKQLRSDFHTPVDRQPRVIQRIDNTSLYSPLAYLPQLVGVWVARHLQCSAVGLLYFGRIASVLCYTLLGWLALRVLPVLKWTACVTLTSPMAMFEAASLSADGMAIATTFLAVALVLRMAMENKPQSLWRVAALAGVMFAMTLCKSAYVPVVLLVFCIPGKSWPRFGWLYPLLIAGVCGVLFLGWSALVHPMGTNMNQSFPPALQLQWVERHPLSYLAVSFRTFWFYRRIYIESYVGDFGWLDVYLPMAAVYLYQGFVISTAVCSDDAQLVSLRIRLVAVVALFCSVLLITLADYVLWTCYRSATIDGVQGRYFIPLALLVLMLMHARCKWRVGSQATTLLVAGYLVATLVTVFQYFYRWRS